MKKLCIFIVSLFCISCFYGNGLPAEPPDSEVSFSPQSEIRQNDLYYKPYKAENSTDALRLKPYPDYTTHTLYTPKGTSVLVYAFLNEIPSSEIIQMDQKMESDYPAAVRLDSATNKYNCHSYAWYLASPENTYWMNDPSAYYTDGSYVESVGNVGDIICYFSNSGANLHSGIVIERNSGVSNGICGDSNLVTVRSKWGSYGLYEHRGDQCFYPTTNGGDATYVKYYHAHDYTTSYTISAATHTAYCSCGAYITENHGYTYRYADNTVSNHIAYCKCGSHILQSHTWILGSGTRYKFCRHCNRRVDTWSDLHPLDANFPVSLTTVCNI